MVVIRVVCMVNRIEQAANTGLGEWGQYAYQATQVIVERAVTGPQFVLAFVYQPVQLLIFGSESPERLPRSCTQQRQMLPITSESRNQVGTCTLLPPTWHQNVKDDARSIRDVEAM